MNNLQKNLKNVQSDTVKVEALKSIIEILSVPQNNIDQVKSAISKKIKIKETDLKLNQDLVTRLNLSFENDEAKIRYNEFAKNFPELELPFLYEFEYQSIITNLNKVNVEYSKYYDNLKHKLAIDSAPLKYIIFYEAPPEKIENYILFKSSNSPWKNVLKDFFQVKFSSNQEEEYHECFANLLIENKCLFVDILPLPIEFDSDLRRSWSTKGENSLPLTFQLFQIAMNKIITDFKIDSKTKFAIGMPPNTSLGIYNTLITEPISSNSRLNWLVKFNLLLENSNSNPIKVSKYEFCKFNSHKSNIFYSGRPDSLFLENAWKSEISQIKLNLLYTIDTVKNLIPKKKHF